jgi:phosphopantetheinyl transferase (holo-ACP synthase)
LLHVGNDVIDLTDPGKIGKSRDVRFINRVFTSGERDFIFCSTHPDETLWTLWAGKEAAYKVMMKTDPRVCSIPRAYPVELNKKDGLLFRGGTVTTPAGTVWIRVFREGDAVHVIGTDPCSGDLEEIHWGVVSVDSLEWGAVPSADRASLLVRECLFRRLSEFLGRSPCEMEVRRLKEHRGLGPPRVYIQGDPSALDISMSHDGRFVAYAFSRT